MVNMREISADLAIDGHKVKVTPWHFALQPAVTYDQRLIDLFRAQPSFALPVGFETCT